jgi:hypothetical protein
MKKGLKIGFFVLLIVAAGLFWWRHYFVFGEGVKAGDLNYMVKKGYIFKTWEGKLIQTGFKAPAPGSMQSNDLSSASKMTALLSYSREPAVSLLNSAIRST